MMTAPPCEQRARGGSLQQDQLDEVELLQAMSKVGEFQWEQNYQTGEISGTMNVHIQLHDSLKLSVEKHSPSTHVRSQRKEADMDVVSKNKIDTSTITTAKLSFEECVDIQHLPPISVYFQFPPTYPAKDPPSFTISCKWMNFSSLTKMCVHMDELWSDGIGSVVLYTWLQFITSEALYLAGAGPDSQYLLKIEDPHTSSPDWDPRAIQDIGRPHLLLSQLADYDRNERTRLFNDSFFTCQICYLSVRGSRCIKIDPCEHVHCVECLTAHISTKINEGDVMMIICPSVDCVSIIDVAIIRHLVSSKMFERFDSLLFQRTLDQMSDIVYCPRPSCQCVALKDDDSNMSQCPKCKFAFCILCKRSWHGVSPCKLLPSDLKELRTTWETLDVEGKLAVEKQYGKKKLEQAFQELDSTMWIESNSKKCPNCDSKIQKTDGCNKMTCTRCQSHFCWLCDAKLPQHDPYGHYRLWGGNNTCAGKLFVGLKGFDDFW